MRKTAIVAVLLAGFGAAQATPAPGVRAAKVSEWGYDAADATKFLQAAFDSDVPTLIIDRQKGPWIVRPIYTEKSNRRIVFEPGVEVQALRGAFKGKGETLLRFNCVTNIEIAGNGGKLKMWREDYTDPAQYSRSEYRHALSLTSCRNVTISGLTCEGSGGDGIYIGVYAEQDPNPIQPKDIVIRDCICDRNTRQGISVISCENLLIENTVLSNTKGMAPEAGIDFEPNRSHAILSNCVMRNCRMFGNASSAVDISINSPCRPISITIENCASDGDLRSFHFDGWHLNPRIDPGFVKFVGCSFRNERAPGDVKVHPTYPLTVTFEKCLFLDNCTENPARPEIEVYSPLAFEPPRPYVRLTDCFVRRRAEGDWLSRTADGSRLAGGFAGDFILERGGRRERVTLGGETKLPPTVLFDPSKVRAVVDPAPGVMRPTGNLQLRAGTRLVFYADRARDIRIRMRQTRIGKSAPSTMRGEFRTVGGELLGRPAAPTEAGGEVVLKAPAKGFYTVSWLVGGHGLAVLGADAPVALDLSESFAYQGLIYAVGEAWLAVPANVPFELFGRGEGRNERWSLAVEDPTGALRAREGAIADWVALGPLSSPTAGLWKLTFGGPDQGSHEDALLGLVGVPAQLFLDRGRYWK